MQGQLQTRYLVYCDLLFFLVWLVFLFYFRACCVADYNNIGNAVYYLLSSPVYRFLDLSFFLLFCSLVFCFLGSSPVRKLSSSKIRPIRRMQVNCGAVFNYDWSPIFKLESRNIHFADVHVYAIRN